MALYDVVNGIYRKVSHKYDPVDGIYRNVKEAYDSVNGVYLLYYGGELPPNTIAAGVYKLSGNSYYSQHFVDEYENYGEDTFEFLLDHRMRYAKSGESFSCDALVLIADTGYLGSVERDTQSYWELGDYWGEMPEYISDAEIIVYTPQTVDPDLYNLFKLAFTLK